MNSERRIIIGVIGAGFAGEKALEHARDIGRMIARQGAVLVCGGLGGVMEAACRGCREEGGETIGILPGGDPAQANPYVNLPIPTNMGHARNIIIAHTAEALIAVEGEYGTLSEMAIGLKIGRPVIAVGSWPKIRGVVYVDSPEKAVQAALDRIGRQGQPFRGEVE